jgi:hypothetical protein
VRHGPMGVEASAICAAPRDFRAELAQQPALSLAALCERVAQAGHRQVTTKIMRLELQRLKLPLKTSLQVREHETERVTGLRTEYEQRRVGFVLKQLKFLDDTGINLALTHRYGARPACGWWRACRTTMARTSRCWRSWASRAWVPR